MKTLSRYIVKYLDTYITIEVFAYEGVLGVLNHKTPYKQQISRKIPPCDTGSIRLPIEAYTSIVKSLFSEITIEVSRYRGISLFANNFTNEVI